MTGSFISSCAGPFEALRSAVEYPPASPRSQVELRRVAREPQKRPIERKSPMGLLHQTARGSPTESRQRHREIGICAVASSAVKTAGSILKESVVSLTGCEVRPDPEQFAGIGHAKPGIHADVVPAVLQVWKGNRQQEISVVVEPRAGPHAAKLPRPAVVIGRNPLCR